MNKKKILIVTRNLPPLIGGMERLNWHIADELSHENEILLLSHKAAQNTAPSNCNFYGVRLNPLPLFLIAAFIKTFLICIIRKPDILFAGSGLTAPITVFWAKFFRKKSIVYIHGLDIKNSSSIYQNCWLPFIRHANSIITNSTPTKALALDKGILNHKIQIVHPGVSYPAPIQNSLITEQLKQDFNLHGKKILLSVGRLTERKGILEFVKLCLPKIVHAQPNTVLVIVGDTANHALNNKFQTKEQILKIAQEQHIAQHIIFTGAINDEQLTHFYYLADLHIFPVKHIPEDPEGFGMVAIEAAAHGTPTVAFATGGIVDAVIHEQSGFLININDYSKFSETVIHILYNTPELQSTCQDFASSFSWNHMGHKLHHAMNLENNSQKS